MLIDVAALWSWVLVAGLSVPTTVTGPVDPGLAVDPCNPPAAPVAPRTPAPFEVDPSNVELLDSSLDRTDPLAALVPVARDPVSVAPPTVPITELPEGAPHEVVAASLARIDGLRHLNLGRSGLRDLQPLAHLRNVERLDLYDTAVSDLRPLAAMTTLAALDLRTTPVVDVTPLSGLKILKHLALDETKVTELGPVSQLSCLEELGLRDTPVARVGPLAGLRRLRELHLDGTAVVDLRPLAKLDGLEVLTLAHTNVRSIRPLARMTDLRVLSLEGTSVTDLRPLHRLRQLDVVDVRRMPIDAEDVEALQDALPFASIYTTVYEEEDRRQQTIETQMRLGTARFELAKTLWRGGERREEARELAQEALDAFLQAGERAARAQISAVREWLVRHPI